jgi:hypothetical protein
MPGQGHLPPYGDKPIEPDGTFLARPSCFKDYLLTSHTPVDSQSLTGDVRGVFAC